MCKDGGENARVEETINNEAIPNQAHPIPQAYSRIPIFMIRNIR